MFKVTSIPLSSEKDASIAIAPEIAKFIPSWWLISWMLISLPFFIPRYGCTNGSPRDSTAHKQKMIWDEKKKINIYVGANLLSRRFKSLVWMGCKVRGFKKLIHFHFWHLLHSPFSFTSLADVFSSISECLIFETIYLKKNFFFINYSCTSQTLIKLIITVL